MMEDGLSTLKKVVQEKTQWSIKDYYNICYNFLTSLDTTSPTRIISPFAQNKHYIFYQYGAEANNKITRPLNTNLFIESSASFKDTFERFMVFLADIRVHQEAIDNTNARRVFLEAREIDKVVYTIQQANGVYYVDPRPDMAVNERLREQIRDFQVFLTRDLWTFSK